MDSKFFNSYHGTNFMANTDEQQWSINCDVMDVDYRDSINELIPIAATEEVITNVFENNNDSNISYISTTMDDKDHINMYTTSLINNVFDQENYHDHNTNTLFENAYEELTNIIVKKEPDNDNENEEFIDETVEEDKRSICSDVTFRSRSDSSSIGDYESHTSDYDDDDDDNNDDDDDDEGGVDDDLILVFENVDNVPNVSKTKIQDNQEKEIISNDFVSPLMEMVTDFERPDLFSDDFGLPSNFDLDLTTIVDKNDDEKDRRISTNTIASDDYLGMPIENFDLAEFITKDDYDVKKEPKSPPKAKNAAVKPIKLKNGPKAEKRQVMISQSTIVPTPMAESSGSSEGQDSDSDSDVFVDVESVEYDEPEKQIKDLKKTKNAPIQEDVPFIDNVKSDPSWSPTQSTKKSAVQGKEEKSGTKGKINSVRKTITKSKAINNSNNKKQSDILKGRGCGVKNMKPVIQRIQKPTANIKKEIANKVCKTSPLANKSLAESSAKKQGNEQNRDLNIKQEMEVKKSMIAEKVAIHNSNNKIPESPKKIEKKVENPAPPQKRKLNLEEYKMRRSGLNTTGIANVAKEETNATTKVKAQQESKPLTSSPQKPVVHSEAVTEIVKSLKHPKIEIFEETDPILRARNKVLRMQEMKRAQQLKIIDSTISKKVARVTKLPLLKDIVKGTCYAAAVADAEDNFNGTQQAMNKNVNDYEEIIIMSAGCNTEITMLPSPPPKGNQIIPETTAVIIKVPNGNPRSLLKSSLLLYNVSDSIQKVHATESMKMKSNSLITSIQDVVVKKTIAPAAESSAGSGSSSSSNQFTIKPNTEHHGEDKIIMHLRKDRIRKPTCSISIQTESLPEFPPLVFAKTCNNDRHSRDRKSRSKSKRNYRKNNHQQSYTYKMDAASIRTGTSRSSRSRSNSSDSFSSSIAPSTADPIGGGYSSRSTRRHRSSVSSSSTEDERHTSQNRRQRRSSYKKRSKNSRIHSTSSTSSMSDDSDRNRSRDRDRSHSRRNNRVYTRSRSPSPSAYRRQDFRNRNNFGEIRNVSRPAVEERRIVYVGRIEEETSKDMLRRKFLAYGTIKQITIHYKENGMKYGFVTFERSQDAFDCIDNAMRDAQINMYDVSFGGRRAFCRADYADLDNAGINTYQSYVFPQAAPPPPKEDSFEALLLKMKAKMQSNKPTTATEKEGSAKNNEKPKI